MLRSSLFSCISIPSVSQICRRQQWQALLVPKPVKSNGGVAVFCHESCALTEVRRISSESGQLIHAVLHGGQRDINVLCIYRHHSDADFAILHEAALIVSRLGSQDWILALDANANMSQGIAHDILENMGGTRCSVARHDRSVHPIDAIWSSGGLQASSASEIPGDGDHTIAQSSFPLAFQNVRRHSGVFRTPAKKWFPSKMFYILVVCGHRWWPPKVIGRKRCSTSTMLGPCGVLTLKIIWFRPAF